MDSQAHSQEEQQGEALSEARTHRLNLRLLRFRMGRDREEPTMLAQELLAEGRSTDAASVVEIALEREPDDADLLMTHGRTWVSRSQPTWAQLFFTRAARVEPDWYEPLSALGRILFDRRRFGKAASVLARAIALGDDDPEIAGLLRTAQRYHGIAKRLHRFRRAPGCEEPVMLATDLLDLGYAKEALEITELALEQDDDDADLAMLRARAHRVRGDLDGAEADLRRATAIEAAWAEPWRMLAEVLLEREQPQEAMTAVEHALTVDPCDGASTALEIRLEGILEELGLDEPIFEPEPTVVAPVPESGPIVVAAAQPEPERVDEADPGIEIEILVVPDEVASTVTDSVVSAEIQVGLELVPVPDYAQADLAVASRAVDVYDLDGLDDPELEAVLRSLEEDLVDMPMSLDELALSTLSGTDTLPGFTAAPAVIADGPIQAKGRRVALRGRADGARPYQPPSPTDLFPRFAGSSDRDGDSARTE